MIAAVSVALSLGSAWKVAGAEESGASMEDVARELANPTNALGKLRTNFDFTVYDGSLPGAGDQSSSVLFFQPALPVPLENGMNFFARPGFPIVFDQPVFNGIGFDGVGTELGDIGYDLGSGGVVGDASVILLGGVVGTIPTATDDRLGRAQWSIGPEFLIGKLSGWGALGILITHQWDFASTDDRAAPVNLTSGQYFYTYLLRGGWAIGAGPQWSYNWEADSDDVFTLPLATGVNRTMPLFGRPWKFAPEAWYFVASPDAFGADWQFRFNVTPVVPLPW
jgi:hypothetical protein